MDKIILIMLICFLKSIAEGDSLFCALQSYTFLSNYSRSPS